MTASKTQRFTAALRREFERCVTRIKIIAEIPYAASLTIKESLRQDKFSETIEEALHCDLFDFWPLPEQVKFIDELKDFATEAREVRAYAQAYALLRRKFELVLL